jgi:radical SAM superfamily enzyme YgiQ (UPF0313 family)
MRICLATLHRNPQFIPLSLLYLKAYLVDRTGLAAADVQIVEGSHAADPDDLVEQVVRTRSVVLGLACYVWNIKKLLTACSRIKERSPQTTIVLGGPEVGPVARAVLEANPAVDVVVRSEGEIPFGEIVACLQAGAGIETVRGVWFRRGHDLVETEEAPILEDLDVLPSPHLRGILDDAGGGGRVICIETQRGCVFRCNFCFYNKDLSIRNRRFHLDRVKQEILYWLERDVVEIYLMDPIFNLNASRAKEICRFIIEHNRRRVPFHAEVWAEFIDQELAELMRQANFEFLEVGLQSTDEVALATVERRLKQQKFVEGVEHLNRLGMEYQLQLIYGLPGDTSAAFRKSLNFAASMNPPDLAVFLLMVLPGTELWRKANGLKLDFEPEPPYFVRSHYSMNAADIQYGRRLADGTDRLGRSKALRVLCREPGMTFADLMDDWVRWAPEHSDTEQDGETLRRFIAHVCDQRQIPPDFYLKFASLEA